MEENIKRFYKKSVIKVLIFLLLLILIVLFFVSLFIGRYSNIDIAKSAKIFLHQVFGMFEQTWSDLDASIILKLRLPRILASILVGASLSLAGAAYQVLFGNPMASPDTLGVSSGASVGACLGILLGWSSILVETSAFMIGCVTVLLSYIIAMSISKGKNTTIFLILTGMVISSFLSSFISIIKYVADPEDQLPAITYWLMGSFASVDMSDVKIQFVVLLLGAVPLLLLSWRINLLSLNSFEARAMGVNVNLLRAITIICATLLTGSSVAISGGIGWVGLVIPHIMRILVGNDCQRLFPTSLLAGSIYLIIMDDLARTISPSEIPIGVLTSLIGAPVFFIILISNRRNLVNEN